MKTSTIFLITILSSTSLFAQNYFFKDIDYDSKGDSVFIDIANSTLSCSLTSLQSKKIYSGKIDLADNFKLSAKGNGFEFSNNYMRSGYACQFEYDTGVHKIKLTAISRYVLGPATNDGSGQSSVDVFMKNYVGNWNYYDTQKDQLIAIPTIRTKMDLTTTYFEDFSEQTYVDYASKCNALYESKKAEMQSNKKIKQSKVKKKQRKTKK